MQDIPVFTGEYGVASLTLSQVPYKQEAYVRIQSAGEPEKFLQECAGFCKAVGAEKIYFCGYDEHDYPVYTELWEMAVSRDNLPDTDAALIPVQENTISRWMEIYNRRMKDVPASAYMRIQDGKKLIDSGNGYFVHRDKELLGIGIASGDTISAIVGTVPGAGREVLLALNHALSGDHAVVEVASVNILARKLYDRLGFLPVKTILKWYCYF